VLLALILMFFHLN